MANLYPNICILFDQSHNARIPYDSMHINTPVFRDLVEIHVLSSCIYL